MVFAWQGLQFEHPEDWSPLSLSGNRKEGYVKICSPDAAFLQLRWKRGGGGVSQSAIDLYLSKLEGDAKRQKSPFKSHTDVCGSRIEYRYRSGISGKGVLFPFPGEDDSGSGLVFLEAVDTPSSVLKEAEATFRVQRDPLERWSLHGLDIFVPSGLCLDSHELRAGKTALQLSGTKMRVVAERWGFAEMLLTKQSLESWTRSLCRLASADRIDGEAEGGSQQLTLYQNRTLLPGVWVKARVRPEANQIDVIRVETRNPDLQPQWNWFAH